MVCFDRGDLSGPQASRSRHTGAEHRWSSDEAGIRDAMGEEEELRAGYNLAGARRGAGG